MTRIIKKDLPLRREEVSREEARTRIQVRAAQLPAANNLPTLCFAPRHLASLADALRHARLVSLRP